MMKSSLIIVTGSNRGIGYALVHKLLCSASKPRIILTSRDVNAGQATLETLIKEYPNEKSRLFYEKLDINSSSSIAEFKNNISKKFGEYDILVNNAAISNRNDVEIEEFRLPEKEVLDTIKTNYTSTVQLTETMLPLLSSTGKIVTVSSNFGQLSHQGENVRELLSNPKMNKETLQKIVNEFTEKAVNYEHIKLGYSKVVYKTTKAFINCYTRWILPHLLKENQTCFACHPGWCKTRLGGTEAEVTAEEGTVSIMAAIDFDPKQAKEKNGKYLNDKGEVDEF